MFSALEGKLRTRAAPILWSSADDSSGVTQSRSITAKRNANSSDCWVLSRGSHALSYLLLFSFCFRSQIDSKVADPVALQAIVMLWIVLD